MSVVNTFNFRERKVLGNFIFELFQFKLGREIFHSIFWALAIPAHVNLADFIALINQVPHHGIAAFAIELI